MKRTATHEDGDRTEAAVWAHGTRHTSEDLLDAYRVYCARERQAGRSPKSAPWYYERVMRLSID